MGAGRASGTGSTRAASSAGAGCAGTMCTTIGPESCELNVCSPTRWRSGIEKMIAWIASDAATATVMRRLVITASPVAAYLRRRMITFPATETAMPIQVRTCQRKPSNAAETTSATIGTITPM